MIPGATSNMWPDSQPTKNAPRRLAVEAGIGVQFPRMRARTPRLVADGGKGDDRWQNLQLVASIGGYRANHERHPSRSTNKVYFVPFCGDQRAWTGRLAAAKSSHQCGVDDRRLRVELVFSPQHGQQQPMQLIPNTGALPRLQSGARRLEPPVRRHGPGLLEGRQAPVHRRPRNAGENREGRGRPGNRQSRQSPAAANSTTGSAPSRPTSAGLPAQTSPGTFRCGSWGDSPRNQPGRSRRLPASPRGVIPGTERDAKAPRSVRSKSSAVKHSPERLTQKPLVRRA